MAHGIKRSLREALFEIGNAVGACRSLPPPAMIAVIGGTAVAFIALLLMEGAVAATTAAIVVALTLLGSETALRWRRSQPVPADAVAPRVASEGGSGDADRDPERLAGAEGCPAWALAHPREPGLVPVGAAFDQARAKLDALCDYVQKLPELFNIMKEHTKNVIDDTERASNSFIENFNEVDRKIKQLRDLVLSSDVDITRIDQKYNDSGARNDELLDHIKTSFEKNNSLIEFIIKERVAFAAIVETMRRLHEELHVIGEIAGKIKLLALNASIEAARASQHGAGFAVIAKEIRDLSDQTHKATNTLSPLIAEACEAVEEIAADQGVEGRLREQLDLFRSMQQHLEALTETFNQMLEHERALTAHTGEHSAGIENAICRTLAELQFQDIVRQQLEGVISAFDDLHLAIESALPMIRDGKEDQAVDAGAVEELITQMRSRYVMAQQRAAHARASGASASGGTGSSAAGSSIELF